MNCKYCHLKTHLIDKCPTIICKNCKEIGHPQWLCKDKKNNKNVLPVDKTLNLDKKYNFSDEIIKKKSSENNIQKNINFYLKLQNEEWSTLGNITQQI